MKILIIGSSGMLGHMLTFYLREQGHTVIDVSRRHKIDEQTIQIDVLQEKSVLQQMMAEDFDAVINCAALLVKPSEEHKSSAVLLNSYFPHLLEEWLAGTKTRILQISTDGVFSGEVGAPYTENSLPQPPTFYGKTKYLGELCNTKDTTVRASFVGPSLIADGTGLLHWLFTSQGEVTGFEGIRFNGITSLEFAKWCEHWLREGKAGLYHLGASSSISKGEFLALSKEIFDLDDVQVKMRVSQNINRSLSSVGRDDVFEIPSYPVMLTELLKWMRTHKKLYPHYSFL